MDLNLLQTIATVTINLLFIAGIYIYSGKKIEKIKNALTSQSSSTCVGEAMKEEETESEETESEDTESEDTESEDTESEDAKEEDAKEEVIGENCMTGEGMTEEGIKGKGMEEEDTEEEDTGQECMTGRYIGMNRTGEGVTYFRSSE